MRSSYNNGITEVVVRECMPRHVNAEKKKKQRSRKKPDKPTSGHLWKHYPPIPVVGMSVTNLLHKFCKFSFQSYEGKITFFIPFLWIQKPMATIHSFSPGSREFSLDVNKNLELETGIVFSAFAQKKKLHARGLVPRNSSQRGTPHTNSAH